ncbi:MAG TPA: translation initiation factor IF-2 [Terriglobales bacterium]|nr:translation initiation factor IF-2 [Terriglobales bacterium]
MVDKIRINDLARELEVKSKAILDVLPKVGVTEKKTHSSSISVEEAEKVKAHFQQGGGDGSSRSASRRAASEDDLKPKFDFSHISKPGDALKAILQKQTAPAAPAKPAAPVAAKPASPAPVAAKPASPAPAPPAPAKPAAPAAEAPAAPKAPVAAPPAPVASAPVVEAPVEPEKPVETETEPELSATPATPAPRLITPQPRQAPRIVMPQAPAPPAAPPAASVDEIDQISAAAETPVVKEPEALAEPKAPAAATPHPPAKSAPPQAPPRRLIVPQTGPRPVYTAPIRPASTPAPNMGTTRPPQGRPQPGRPVPGQPIFQRPRPQGATGAPPMGGRPPLRPGERRPMHPTRSAPMGGMRPPGMGGPGMAPPPPPGPTRAPGRRPGQRYVPRGVKEGPMKGFVPPPRMQVSNEPLPITRNITITEGISVKDLAEKLEIRAKDLIARLVARGVFATINQTLDAELANEMARQFGASTDVITFEQQAEQDMLAGDAAIEDAVNQQTRPPVVTIMGHVDHGKTSLLDAIRHTAVAEGEAGGITQHIGAYKVRISDQNSPAYGRQIVFLDTPGHEAFTRMRARGAKVTDIVVLVVAADDGVMPQTIEAIDHAKAADVPLIVAVNKIDKPDAMPDRVKKQLGDRGLLPEEWGGTTVFVDVSAKQRTNLNLLMEMICLVADLQELKANPERSASGVVIEAKLDRGRGPVATVLVENGTLKTGDYFVVGNVFGRVRAMFDDRSNALDEAGPSTPVEILGLEGLPQAGDQFTVLADREKAVGVAEYRQQKAREATLAKSSKVSLEGLAEQLKSEGTKELSIILKGDVGGSVEVLNDLLTKLSNEKVKIKILRGGVGAITESDVLLASASNAIIIGFNVRPERKAQELAEQEKVDIRLHSIIYELQDEIKRAMTGMLEPVFKETYQGRAEVRDTFRVPKVGTIAGCYVQDGIIKRDSQVRLLRDNVVIFTGKVGSLRRFKDDASEVRNGMECGIGIAGYGDIKVGDVIEAFVTEKVAAEAIA